MEYYDSKILLALGYLLECLNSKDGEMQRLAHELKELQHWEPPMCQDCKHFKAAPDDHKVGTCDRLQQVASVHSEQRELMLGDSYVTDADVYLPRLFGCYSFEEEE